MKNILVIAHIASPPVYAGNQKCIFEYCELLRKNGFNVHFLFVQGREKLSITDREELKKYWKENLHIFRRSLLLEILPRIVKDIRAKIFGYNRVDDRYPIGLTNYVKRINKKNKFDAIIVNYVILSKLFEKHQDCTKIIYTHDVFSNKKTRLGVKKFWFDLSPNEESKGLNRADILLSIQENETIYFRYLCPDKIVETTYSYFPIEQQRFKQCYNLLFLSGKSVLNQNAIRWFVKDVFPLVVKSVPDVKLYIGGSICEYIKDIESDNIVLVGRVKDESEFYQHGNIAINPVYQGTGLKIKTFEAMSYGKAVVAHTHSAEGIYNKEHAPVLVAETSEMFATYLNRLLLDFDYCDKISKSSIEYIKELNKYVEKIFIQTMQ